MASSLADGSSWTGRATLSATRTSVFFFSSRRRHTRFDCDWSSDVCSSDLFRPSHENDVLLVTANFVEGGAERVRRRRTCTGETERRSFNAESRDQVHVQRDRKSVV